MAEENKNKPIEYPYVPSATSFAMKGKTFIGQTRVMRFGEKSKSWGALVNPVDSGVNVYLNTIYVTNITTQLFTAELFFNVTIPEYSLSSGTITSTNFSMTPQTTPRARIKYLDGKDIPLTGGINIFGRIIPADFTFTMDDIAGNIILGEGKSLSILLEAPDQEMMRGLIFFNWWEEEIL